ncbi:hypothetical protein [Gluconobacter wancherniae]|uniref:Uncharacterized protein n=1 Tax=Gluconobacter wancherniae NBRC 103581 TaxID=656744 RepID=A0A511AYX0_9PROT|nr:hypothetical protein [Gluconobacter wancherniae]MBF0853536.1 hypothetical protein [Gluconobacter wancherniae]MBS1089084.1 hypothetical protein [Gluconobacter wancherniae]GBD55717.1 hypothetical protein NBRC103581_00284 [Gluconobacter wancherniae NBRC 103581]GBR66259.1 hypothetical protein AA103581_2259 [Gluconobacter wancherniae NBRC 103581]GEK93376.1 hypothetical protein GWA01_11460 [Gluconobacter wancherniae NBRC 103581]
MADEWKLKEDGNLDISSLTGFRTVVIQDGAVVLQLKAATAAEHFPEGDKLEQFSLSPQTAAELGRDLLDAVEILLQKPAGEVH